MMLKQLIQKHGKDKINTLTKYPSILTLHKFGEKGRLTNTLTTNIEGEQMYASEKIDGTNVRIICLGDEFLVGSRKCILHYSEDFYWDEAMGIVNQFYQLNIPVIKPDKLTIVYGELFGGKITAHSKNYGKEKHGFRVFDIAVIEDLSILEKSIPEISSWRESALDVSVNETLKYGQGFITLDSLEKFPYELVPKVEFELKNFEHQTVLDALNKYIPTTQVALSETAKMGTEGVILRNADRTKIVKLRFEDYRRTLR